MKAAFAALALGLACSGLHAQVLERPQSPAVKEDPKKDKAAPKPDRPAPAVQPHHDQRRRHAQKPPVERETSEGPVKLDRARPAETYRPGSPPSPAEQQQRQQYEQRQPQRDGALR